MPSLMLPQLSDPKIQPPQQNIQHVFLQEDQMSQTLLLMSLERSILFGNVSLLIL
jgi:hypothetical protein